MANARFTIQLNLIKRLVAELFLAKPTRRAAAGSLVAGIDSAHGTSRPIDVQQDLGQARRPALDHAGE
jgi:hypothetical protein